MTVAQVEVITKVITGAGRIRIGFEIAVLKAEFIPVPAFHQQCIELQFKLSVSD